MWNEAVCFFLILAVTAILAGLIVWLLMRRKLSGMQAECERLQVNCDSCHRDRRHLQQELDKALAAQAQLQAEAEPKTDEDIEDGSALELVGSVVPQPEDDEVEDSGASKQNEDDLVLQRVKERAQQIDFGRIGVASAEDRDDLKIIKGIGPFIEKKLNALGIYTFEQIAKFNPNDEEKVNEAIEFFPGRIRRDEWARQARELADNND